MGLTLANFISSGTIPELKDLLIMINFCVLRIYFPLNIFPIFLLFFVVVFVNQNVLNSCWVLLGRVST